MKAKISLLDKNDQVVSTITYNTEENMRGFLESLLDHEVNLGKFHMEFQSVKEEGEDASRCGLARAISPRDGEKR